MREFLIIIAVIILAVALRSSRTCTVRKLGAITFLIATGLAGYYISENIWIGMVSPLLWFMLPWVELLTRIRSLRMPLENKLKPKMSPDISLYPEAHQAIKVLEDAGFEHVRACGWDWGDMKQVFELYWNPEERTVAQVCLCEQSHVTFSYLSMSSKDVTKGIWRTTNYPFSQTLKPTSNAHWNQVSCSITCPDAVLESHHGYLIKQGLIIDDLLFPDPDIIELEIETEMRSQIDHNLQAGIIELTGDGYFKYTFKGLLYLWYQFVRDMIRLS
ncbi:hypothetical protein [Persicirhabdus sediminis]|uniref:Uncharacterized protein n=1 Tax=Persicirhabdus sediminis TaxID=454144 RepID=A0A8J7MDL8_9BACT|nr:hypothetical protein [Persicirhabdus sediminis]MBK1791301.1 hypothetical protein [Persicirhabdus sediminis]